MTTYLTPTGLKGTLTAALNSTDTTSQLKSAGLNGQGDAGGAGACPTIASPNAVKLTLYAVDATTKKITVYEEVLGTAFTFGAGESTGITVTRAENSTTEYAWPVGSAFALGWVSDASFAPAVITETYATADTTVPTVTAATVATTAATNTSPYGYAQAQADAIVTNLNKLVADVTENRKLIVELFTLLAASGDVQPA